MIQAVFYLILNCHLPAISVNLVLAINPFYSRNNQIILAKSHYYTYDIHIEK